MIQPKLRISIFFIILVFGEKFNYESKITPRSLKFNGSFKKIKKIKYV